MKKFLIAALWPGLALAQANKGFVLNGTIKGLKDSTLVFLTDATGNTTFAQDYSKNGKFILKGSVQESDIYQLQLIGKTENVTIFMGNDQMVLTGEQTKLDKVVITGSPLHNDYAVYQQQFDPLRLKLNNLVQKINATQQGKVRDSLINQFNATKNAVVDQVNKFVKAKPNSPVSAFVLYAVNPLFVGGVQELETKYNALQPKAKKGLYAKMIEDMITKAKTPAPPAVGQVGTIAPDFSQPDPDGKMVALSSFRGKYVLVDFWASWCRPCRMENPNVVEAYKAFKDKGFTVLGVSFDRPDGKDNWLQAIKDDNLTWTHVSDLKFWNNAAGQLYGIQSIPANMLIDPQGKIIAKDLRGEALTAKLKEIFPN